VTDKGTRLKDRERQRETERDRERQVYNKHPHQVKPVTVLRCVAVCCFELQSVAVR